MWWGHKGQSHVLEAVVSRQSANTNTFGIKTSHAATNYLTVSITEEAKSLNCFLNLHIFPCLQLRTDGTVSGPAKPCSANQLPAVVTH